MNRSRIASIALVSALAGLLLLTASSPGAMRVKKLSASLCQTTGGGKIVNIPGFPGERIDRRLMADIRYLKQRYKIFITDGYSNDKVHAWNGEHPMGLALDIAPDSSRGGTWRDITRLAKAAEPRQNQPVAPFRWVGYDGDSGHGRGHHLHLSWNHSETKPGTIAQTVYTMRCPGAGGGTGGSAGGGGNTGGGQQGGGTGSGGPGGTQGTTGGIGGSAKGGKKTKGGKKAKTKRSKKKQGQSSGGVIAGSRTTRSRSTSGGLGAVPLRSEAPALFSNFKPVIETAGIDAR